MNETVGFRFEKAAGDGTARPLLLVLEEMESRSSAFGRTAGFKNEEALQEYLALVGEGCRLMDGAGGRPGEESMRKLLYTIRGKVFFRLVDGSAERAALLEKLEPILSSVENGDFKILLSRLIPELRR